MVAPTEGNNVILVPALLVVYAGGSVPAVLKSIRLLPAPFKKIWPALAAELPSLDDTNCPAVVMLPPITLPVALTDPPVVMLPPAMFAEDVTPPSPVIVPTAEIVPPAVISVVAATVVPALTPFAALKLSPYTTPAAETDPAVVTLPPVTLPPTLA